MANLESGAVAIGKFQSEGSPERREELGPVQPVTQADILPSCFAGPVISPTALSPSCPSFSSRPSLPAVTVSAPHPVSEFWAQAPSGHRVGSGHPDVSTELLCHSQNF